MVARRSILAGLVTGLAFAVLALFVFLFWDQLGTVWTLAFLPVFVTSVYAV